MSSVSRKEFLGRKTVSIHWETYGPATRRSGSCRRDAGIRAIVAKSVYFKRFCLTWKQPVAIVTAMGNN